MRNRSVGIHIRVTENEKRKLSRNARKSHLSLSEYLRKLGTEQEVHSLPQKEFYEIYRAVEALKEDAEFYQPEEISRELQEISQQILNVYLQECGGDDHGCDEDLAD